MKPLSLLLALTPVLLLTACNEPPRHYPSEDETGYIGANNYKVIPYSFTPGATYNIRLKSYSGDADLAILNNNGGYIVYSAEDDAHIDAVTFTAKDYHYDIEVYGYHDSEYQLIIIEVPYYEVGLNITADSIEFNIDIEVFSGVLYTELASETITASHHYDHLTIEPVVNQSWLSLIPTTPTNNLNAQTINFHIKILETTNPLTHNDALIRLTAKDYNGKIKIFKDIDVTYNVTDSLH
ncbi:MAG: hypothetical protein GXP08_16265 [Gammaproteobacteria bacterium]|nr:hypothetical protein [Gammaproteobacteria bacterium]